MAVDSVAGRAMLFADGEAVWSWHPDADAKSATMLSHCAGDGGKKARSPGRARNKPSIRRAGNAGPFRLTCGDYACVLLHFAHKAAGAARAPGIPCAIFARVKM